MSQRGMRMRYLSGFRRPRTRFGEEDATILPGDATALPAAEQRLQRRPRVLDEVCRSGRALSQLVDHRPRDAARVRSVAGLGPWPLDEERDSDVDSLQPRNTALGHGLEAEVQGLG